VPKLPTLAAAALLSAIASCEQSGTPVTPAALHPADGAFAPASVTLFQNYWLTGTGSTESALLSTSEPAPGQPWTAPVEDGGLGMLSVVNIAAEGLPAIAGYANALRVQQRGSTADPPFGDPRAFANVHADNVLPLSTDYFLRYYVLNNDRLLVLEDGSFHPVEAPTTDELTYQNRSQNTSGWGFKYVIAAQGQTPYPVYNWFLNPPGFNSQHYNAATCPNQTNPYPLAMGTWYRVETWVHFVDATHIQVTPRVYAGTSTTVLYDESNFQQEDYGCGAVYPDPGGTDDWTLANWKSRGESHSIAPSLLTSFRFGNNGATGATDTQQFYYYAGVKVCGDTWCGP
jgi:hypothetical protein